MKCNYDTKVSLTTCVMIISVTAGAVFGAIPADVWGTIVTGIVGGYFGSLHGSTHANSENPPQIDPYK